MSPASENFYAQWRRRCGIVPTLREGGGPPPEQLLQAIWQQQRIHRERLTTTDGRLVRVLHPGFISVEGGPDFRGAVIQFGDDKPISGDVEVDLQSSGWHSHGHDKNPSFKSVILHVVWAAPKNKSAGPPALVVGNALDAPLNELAEWLGGDAAPGLPEKFQGRCAAPLRELDEAALQELLQQAALVRLHGKSAQLAARAREAGWEQSLWEGLFRALGYKHNTWPMQRLAELRPRWADGENDAGLLQSRLLGIAGLLPAELTRAQSAADGFVRQLWDRWWRERDSFEEFALPRSIWRLHGIRPLNHPQRRLALASHWLAAEDLIGELEGWCANLAAGQASGQPAGAPRKRLAPAISSAAALAKILQPAADDFWSHHLTLRSVRSAKPQLLLGEARVTDLAVNVILPWLRARAAEGRNTKIESAIEATYCNWPAGEDNSVLKLARIRLLGGTSLKIFRTAAAQQGLMQVIRDYCDHSNAICDDCRFPELVRSWQIAARGP